MCESDDKSVLNHFDLYFLRAMRSETVLGWSTRVWFGGVDVISTAGLEIAEIITDRHKQNTAWIRRNLANTRHYFDIWHVSKGNGLPLLQNISFTRLALIIDGKLYMCRELHSFLYTTFTINPQTSLLIQSLIQFILLCVISF